MPNPRPTVHPRPDDATTATADARPSDDPRHADDPRTGTRERPRDETSSGGSSDEDVAARTDQEGVAARSPLPAATSPGARQEGDADQRPPVFEMRDVAVRYGDFVAVKDVTLDIPCNQIVAFIGPSGCGKSTLLRTLNRMNDLVPGAAVDGTILYHDHDIYSPEVDPVEVRRRVGMVFQKPNPFPKSIYENVTFGAKINGFKGDLDELVERSLRRAALWDEVKDKLHESAYALSGGQQQRLCIARTIAVEPDVILMDEPCSALDPIATLKIEDLMRELTAEYTIVIVTHNMQQAARISDHTAFLTLDVHPETDARTGMVVEYDTTERIFTNASDERTEAYITGRFG